ncbi:hypothetical protein [Bacillus sp. NPDC094106]|uniref:hypothetical protein n=1 Tax=Bacillus sp. NPDC094106 TaxID=3363949 RepID=UPI00382EE9F8
MNKITVKNTEDLKELYAEFLLTPLMIYAVLKDSNQLDITWTNKEGYKRMLNVLARYITKRAFLQYSEIEMKEKGFEDAYISACLSHDLLKQVEKMPPLIDLIISKLKEFLQTEKELHVDTFIRFNTYGLKRSTSLFVQSMDNALNEVMQDVEEANIPFICFQTLMKKGKSLYSFKNLSISFHDERVQIMDTDKDIYTVDTMEESFGIQLYKVKEEFSPLIHDLSFIVSLVLLMETEEIVVSTKDKEFIELLQESFDKCGLSVDVNVE